MIIDTIRPNGTTTSNFALTGGATLHAVTSDNSDATYGLAGPGNGFAWQQFPNHTPAADHARHKVRWRVRSRQDDAGGAGFTSVTVELEGPTGDTVNFQTFSDIATPSTHAGAWVSPEAADLDSGAAISFDLKLTYDAILSSDEWRVLETYIDIDTRERPSFTADILDGAGVSRDGGTVTDTPAPTLEFGVVDYDGLPARTWSVVVRTDPGGVVVFSASGSGIAPTSIETDPLVNGDYEADLAVSSTIRVNDSYPSGAETVAWTQNFVAPATPVLTSTPITSPPAVELDWVSDSPTATTWDVNADVVTEIRRTDCNGTRTFYVEQTGIGAAEFIDRFMGLAYDGVFCGEIDHTCEVCYEARYWGLVDDVLVASEWSDEICETIANPTPGNSWLRGASEGDLSACLDEDYGRFRPFGVFQPIDGGMPTVITGTPSGRNYNLSFALTSEADLVALEAILAQPLFFYQPVGQADLWLAPNVSSVQVVKVGRARRLSVDTVAVNPQPVADPASFFA
jgi:hypothetical protein